MNRPGRASRVRTSWMGVCVLLGLMTLVSCNQTDRAVDPLASKSVAGAPGPVFMSVQSEGTLRQIYPTLADMVNSAAVPTIVDGTITAVDFVAVEGSAHTVMTVAVATVYRGQAGKSITVWESGGFLPMSAIAAQFEAKTGHSMTAAEKAGYVDERFEGAAHPQVGDQVALFLIDNPNTAAADTYDEAGGVFGRLTLSSQAATYSRAGTAPASGFQMTIDRLKLQSLLARP